MRLIDAEQFLKHILESKVFTQYFKELVQSLIWGEKTVNAVPVVRCGECKYSVKYGGEVKYCEVWAAKCNNPFSISLAAGDYCSFGAITEDKT